MMHHKNILTSNNHHQYHNISVVVLATSVMPVFKTWILLEGIEMFLEVEMLKVELETLESLELLEVLLAVLKMLLGVCAA